MPGQWGNQLFLPDLQFHFTSFQFPVHVPLSYKQHLLGVFNELQTL